MPSELHVISLIFQKTTNFLFFPNIWRIQQILRIFYKLIEGGSLVEIEIVRFVSIRP